MRPDGSTLERHGEIVIVRRRHEEEEGHHGGVWKIAFADFMTALMAFFLVMWLVNASDDATKRQVAQYFNPIKLNAPTPPAPGLETGDERQLMREPRPAEGAVESPGAPGGRPVGGEERGGEDQAIFRDPYAVLAEIVAGGGPGTTPGRADPVPDGTGLPGLNGGDAYRDPFDPTSWQLEPNILAGAPAADPIAEAAAESAFATAVEETTSPAEPAEPLPRTEIAAVDPALAHAVAAESEARVETAVPMPETEASEEPALADASADSETEAIERELSEAAEATAPGSSGAIEVSRGEEGIVISLADSLSSGMFEVGSARPSADAIRIVEDVARILAEREGTVVIRGHTDARPYQGGEYDNWRLSTSRAHMAYYMLLRGGLDEARVSAIEGFADRRLKIADDPEAAANRRIEILLVEPAA